MTRSLAALLALSLAGSAQAADVSVGVALAGNLRLTPGDGDFANDVSANTTPMGAGVGLAVPVRIHVNDLAAVRIVTHVNYSRAPVSFTYQSNNYRYFGSALLIGETLGGEMAFSDADTRPYLFGEVGGGALRYWPRTVADNADTLDGDLCVLRDTVDSCTDPLESEIFSFGGTALVNLGLGVAAGDLVRLELGYLRGSLPSGAAVKQGAAEVTLLEGAYQAVQVTVGVALGG